jgi:6-pyruvoyl-tetrahydropterin synthase
MSDSWPKVSGKFTQKVTIFHALPSLGNPDQHSHEFEVSLGWVHEVNPFFGYTWSLEDTQGKINRLLAQVDGKNLNDVLPVPPTAEMLACWLLSQAPEFYDYVEIRCYENYQIRVDRRGVRANDRFFGSNNKISLTT